MQDIAVELTEGGVFYREGEFLPAAGTSDRDRDEGRRKTITHGILAAHNGGSAEPGEALHLRFDALASHDITYVGIIQTARVSGLKSFPLPYILTNCHNSLCAVGGTINEDDHVFGLDAARKYGGIYVPPHLGVIHSYMREAWAGCGKMILGSDSHTRYGALGTLAVGEGGGELVKQLLSQSYDTAWPRIVAVYLTGTPPPGVGPMDAALALIGTVFAKGFAKNAVLEFTGPGITSLPVEYRNGIDVMTTETACWSSIWETDEKVRDYLTLHGRAEDYRELRAGGDGKSGGTGAYYDGLVRINLDKLKPMIAMPFHPSNVYELEELIRNPGDVFRQTEKGAETLFGKPVDLGLMNKIDSRGRIHVDQGIIAGCAGGTFDNIMAAAEILTGRPPGQTAEENTAGNGAGSHDDTSGFGLSVYPGSQAVYLELARNGALADLTAAGAVVKSAFCGPCFGAGDVPAHQGLSIRHTTRNFPNREGSKPDRGQIAQTALMDARSIAATARNGGILTSAGMYAQSDRAESGAKTGAVGYAYHFDPAPYRARVYNGMGRPDAGVELRCGPNIGDWPSMNALGENLLVKIVSFITDPVTTTDELIPSGETSSYRSNPLALAEFTLSRKDPAYVGRAKAVYCAVHCVTQCAEQTAEGTAQAVSGVVGAAEQSTATPETAQYTAQELAALRAVLGALGEPEDRVREGTIQIVSALFAVKPGDGSAREQAASCQRVLGGGANFANEYATKRYRSNLINWGLIPFIVEGTPPFCNGDYLFIPGVRSLVRGERRETKVRIVRVQQAAGPDKHGGQASAAVIGAAIVGDFSLAAPELNPTERELLLAGSLINHNRNVLEGRNG